MHFWQGECQTLGISDTCEATAQYCSYLRCWWWFSGVEMVRVCPKGPNPVSFGASGTVLQVITELFCRKKKAQMLHLGHEDGTDCFPSLFQTKGMGETEWQWSDRVAKGKEMRTLPCWRRHCRVGS